jgi:hypothetical protein
MAWKCSKIKISSIGEMLESTTHHGVADKWDRPSKSAREVMRLRKGQYYTTVMDKITGISWEYFYIMYQIPNQRVKLKGENCDQYKANRDYSERNKKNYLAKKRDNSGFKGPRVKRSKAKEAMSRV